MAQTGLFDTIERAVRRSHVPDFQAETQRSQLNNALKMEPTKPGEGGCAENARTP
jgi:hypothetical protein